METEKDREQDTGPDEEKAQEAKPEDNMGKKPSEHTAKSALKDAAEKAKHSIEEKSEQAREASQRAREKIKQAGQKAMHTVEETGEKAREKLGEAEEKTREARQRAKDKLGKAGGKASETGRKLMELISEGVRRVGESHWFRSITVQAWAGLGLTLVYFFFLYFEQLNYRWWVMLPLGAAGLYLLGLEWYRAEDRKGVNAMVCLVAFVFLALLVVYRDALLSEMMLDRMQEVKGIKEVFK